MGRGIRDGAHHHPARTRCGKAHIDTRASRRVDLVDFRLLGMLHEDALASHDRLAGRVGLSASAIRKRLAALREDGILHGFLARPAPELFGRVAVGAAWERTIPLDALLALDETVWAADSVAGASGALAYARDPADWLRRANALAGVPPMQEGTLPASPVAPLGPLEWRVAIAMLDHPTGTLRELAGSTGLSTRTVASRRAVLLAGGAIRVEPMLRTSRGGAIAYHVNVQAPRRAWPDARAALGDTIMVADYGASVYLFCLAPDLATHVRNVEAARRVEGVARLDVVLNRDFRVASTRLRGWMVAELDAWQRARPR